MTRQAETRFTATLERSDNKLWGAHFRVPRTVAQRFIDGDTRRVVCTLNDTVTYQCAMLPFGNGVLVISVNKKLRDSLGLEFGGEVHVKLSKDESKYGLPMPDELNELFRQDKEGKRLFHALTPGKQRTLLYIIGKGKDPEIRIARSITIIAHLKINGGKINYRQLNSSLKPPRP